MSCFHGYDFTVGHEDAFAVDGNAVTFGPGVLAEGGAALAALGCTRVALFAYVNAPIGEGRAVPGPLPPHVACPTTAGTGSECTGIAIFDAVARGVKTGIASRRLRPTQALVDPTCTETLPPSVVAAAGFDVLSHAVESYTARPYTARAKPSSPSVRPMSQGRNPWSDVGSLEALRLCGRHLVAAVAGDADARHAMAWAATLAGIAFGNAGVHLPHAMSMMRQAAAPNGTSAIGYSERDLPQLAKGACAQKRLVDNAPRAVDEAAVAALFADALRYW